jgi:long-chain fatty acid transport protein
VIRLLLLTALLVCAPAVARADPLDVFGIGARGVAMGGAQAAVADDYTALYYNVANLAFEEGHAGAGLLLSFDDVSLRLKARPPGYDLPDRGSSSAAIPTAARLQARGDTDDIANTHGVYVGLVGSLGFERLRVGVMAYLPANTFTRLQTRYPDEREQYFSNRLDFELLGLRTQRQGILGGLAWRFNDRLSMGAGVSFLPGGETTNHVLVQNPTDQSDIALTLDNNITGRLAPLLGLSVQPTERIKVGLAWRGEQFFSLKGENQIQIRGLQGGEGFPVIQRFEVVSQYSPHQVVFGSSYRDEGYVLSVDVTYNLWSRYLNQQGERVAFADTFTTRLGIEAAYSPSLLLRGGLGYAPSPVPAQTGRTNYVDNDRVVVSLGTGHKVRLLEREVEIGWSAQLQWLRPRDTNKARSTVFEPCAEGVALVCDELPDDAVDAGTGLVPPEHLGLQTGNPGFPGFVSSGAILTMGLDARWSF